MTEQATTRRRGATTRTAGAVLALGALAVLSACGGDTEPAEPPPASDAVTGYEQTRQDVLAAVQDVYGADGWADDGSASTTAQDDGRCVVFLPDASTTRAGGEGYDRLADVPDALAPVLDEHGFGEPSDVVEAEHGGSASVEAEDPAGWSVRVTADGDLVRLDVSGPVDLDPCDEAGLPELG
ncbi:hypothetical protein CBR64_05705 [Cellulosimicrobium cellulans]|uniref:Uncharacterized protein n=1 Tax=Cellulosimicrobium cellulans TaxID=1710 RepID=A0A1Y0HSC1_CELCE|nr:hypothetical protein [Cellulosimicrobium cellulans]ARU51058.1 hypothetical protein CBR64_05705 [Cellulosimicrobium cellulans]